MKSVVVCVVIAACLIGAFAAEESKVVVLNSKNFDEKTKEGLWLIKFFAPWCGHCKRLAPTWIELSGKAGDKFNVGEVDCTAEKDICTRFAIRGYPTIKFIANGAAPEEVRVPRTVEAYMDYIDKYLNAGKKPEEKKPEEKKPEEKKPEEKKPEEKKGEVVVLNAKNFEEKTKEGLWLVKFFAPWCGHCKHLAPTWIDLAGKTEGKFNVGEVDCTAEKDICNRFAIRGYPTIKFFANGAAPEEVRVPRTVEAYKEYIEKYLNAGKKPEEKKPEEKKPEEKKPEEKKSAVLSLTKETFDAELEKKPLAVKFFAPWCGHCKRLAPTWEEFAAANKESSFVVAEVDCTAQRDLCVKYEVNGYPTILFLRKGEKAVEFNGARTKEALQTWADGFGKKEHSEL